MGNNKKNRLAARRLKGTARRGKNEFARMVTEALRRAGETGPIRFDAGRFCLVGGKGRGTLFLANAYQHYAGTRPAERRPLLGNLVQCWFLDRTEIPATYMGLKPGLLPDVKDRATYELDRLRKQPGSVNPYLPLAEHFGVTVVYNQPVAKAALTGEELTARGVTFGQAFEAACDNLRAMSQASLVALAPGVWASPWRDNYDAARLVLHDVVRRHPVRGDHVAVVPNRDTLLVTGSEDVAGLGIVASQCERGLRQGWPLSGVALRLEGDSWVPFLPAADHPHYPPFKRLRLMSFGNDYTRQKAALEAIRDEKGEDYYVANYLAAGDANTGLPFSYGVWTEGIQILLPHTDKVGFARVKDGGRYAQGPGLAPWERVRDVVGHLMEPLGVYPERYRVRTYPTADQLAAIGPCHNR